MGESGTAIAGQRLDERFDRRLASFARKREDPDE
jgi:hypothetical protein